VPSFHDPKYSDVKQNQGKDGYLFHTARHGVPAAVAGQAAKMPGYAHALSVKDSWAVIAYIRALQETEKGTAADIPTAEREALEQKRVKPAPKAPEAAPAAPATTGGTQ
jgi:mono/diheme cytochrome c family protein